MPDVPLLIVALTVSAYWLRVGAMVVRARRKQHRDVGVMPERPGERVMWLVFVAYLLLRKYGASASTSSGSGFCL